MHGSPASVTTAARSARQTGFSYVGLMIAVALIGLMLAEVGVVWRTQAQREREQELLFIGREFRNAIASYYGSGAHMFPQNIEDLLEDKRFPEPKHHLRRMYVDPMTGAADWTYISVDLLGITGVASSSKLEPLKKKGFSSDEEKFEDATCYCDWQFIYTPRIGRRRGGTAQPAVD